MVMCSAMDTLTIPKPPALPHTPPPPSPPKLPPPLPTPNTPPPLPPPHKPINPQNAGIYQKLENVLTRNKLSDTRSDTSNTDVSINYEETRKIVNSDLESSNSKYEDTRKYISQSIIPPQKSPTNQNQEASILEERRITQKLVEGSKIIMRNESLRSKISNKSATSQRSGGFRLKDGNNNSSSATSFQDKEDSGSIYSIYKQKIDSMFGSDTSSPLSNTRHNSVQAKIEKMFSDVAKDSGIQPNQIGVHTFSVDYLGSIPLHDKVTSLDGLQTPLKDLYFPYKRQAKHKQKLSGRLEISSQGLRVQYQGENGDLEQMNSFPTIAVWSAVKFVVQDSSTSGNTLSYAFLPLITDPDNLDKQMLFQKLQNGEKKFIHSDENHSPLFAVVMRKFGIQKQLECHGFVCQTSEDAIVIAATLYKSLVSHMKHKEKKPKNKNGVTTCMSTTSSIVEKSKDEKALPVRPPRKKRSNSSSVASDNNSIANISEVQTMLDSQQDNKPPKRSTKTRRAPKAPSPENDDLEAILPYEEPVNILRSESGNCSHNDSNSNDEKKFEDEKQIKPKSFSDKLSAYITKEQKQIAEEIKKKINNPDKGLRHVEGCKKPESIRKAASEESMRKKENSGDILTKVTIPRSGSFLNTGGLTRYKSKISRTNDSTSGGSPLGFKEIFHELSLQEGLYSLDDVLSVIIDPDGMSFNDLKPIYKEFLLKLAVTLTKDELYLKSKSIMRRQKKKLLKRSQSTKRSPNLLSSTKIKRLKHIFQKSLKVQPPASFRKQYKENPINVEGSIDIQINTKLPESSIDTSSYDTRQFRTKEELTSKKQGSKKKSSVDLTNSRGRDRASTSEESDFLSLKRKQKLKSQNMNLLASNQNRNSSSGYVSCSECSYDSDTCTCTSADKCYCSLGQQKSQFEGDKKHCVCNEDLTFCGCDTDSCAESNKCYCPYGPQSSKIHSKTKRSYNNSKTNSPNSKKYGHKSSEQNIIDEHSFHQHSKHKKLCKKSSNSKSTRSLEYMSNPSETYYEKLRSKSKFGSERVGHTSYYEDHSNNKKRRNSHSGINPYTRVETFEEMNLIALDNIQKDLTRGGKSNFPSSTGDKISAMDYELLKLAKVGNIGDLETLRDYWAGTRSYESYRGNFSGRGSRSIQSAITSGACSEALSVKKSAEIAALFADIKLSQTTDITHLTSQGFGNDSGPTSRIIYEKSSSQAKYSTPIKPQKQHQPALPYKPSSGNRPGNSSGKNKSHLYSTRNGLYTIQSQSDESRRSSLSDSKNLTVSDTPRKLSAGNNGRTRSPAVDYIDIEISPGAHSRNMENSLGYLP